MSIEWCSVSWQDAWQMSRLERHAFLKVQEDIARERQEAVDDAARR